MQDSQQSNGKLSKGTPLKIFVTMGRCLALDFNTQHWEYYIFSPFVRHRMVINIPFCLVNELLAGCTVKGNNHFPRCISRLKYLCVNFSTPHSKELLAQIKTCNKNHTESMVTNSCKSTLGRHICYVASRSCLSCSFHRYLPVRFCLLVLYGSSCYLLYQAAVSYLMLTSRFPWGCSYHILRARRKYKITFH